MCYNRDIRKVQYDDIEYLLVVIFVKFSNDIKYVMS